LNLYQSAVGKKWVMGLTGIALLGFVVVHMLGNLHLYEGAWETHEYAETLRDLGTEVIPRTWVLWALRIGLIAAFALHIHSAYRLTRMSTAADRRYQGGRDYVAANFASRTMRWTGPLVGLFVVYHLADLTWGHFNPDYVRGDPYHNVVASLSNLPVAIWYIIANVALAVHIYHGAWSMFQSLGINSPRWNALRRRFAQAFAAVILVGNLSFPILVQSGVIDDGGRSVVREHQRAGEIDSGSAARTGIEVPQ
jgi:succinate dehydrogenase / fumarate reductase cytochrome b subunit